MSTTETFEEIEFEEYDEKAKKPHSFAEIFVEVLTLGHFKLLAMIFIIFLFVNSDVFIDKILGNIDGATINKMPQTKGIVVQGIFLILATMVIDICIRAGFP